MACATSASIRSMCDAQDKITRRRVSRERQASLKHYGFAIASTIKSRSPRQRCTKAVVDLEFRSAAFASDRRRDDGGMVRSSSEQREKDKRKARRCLGGAKRRWRTRKNCTRLCGSIERSKRPRQLLSARFAPASANSFTLARHLSSNEQTAGRARRAQSHPIEEAARRRRCGSQQRDRPRNEPEE